MFALPEELWGLVKEFMLMDWAQHDEYIRKRNRKYKINVQILNLVKTTYGYGVFKSHMYNQTEEVYIDLFGQTWPALVSGQPLQPGFAKAPLPLYYTMVGTNDEERMFTKSNKSVLSTSLIKKCYQELHNYYYYYH